MTAVRMIYLDCDIPDCESTTADETFNTARDARHFAHRSGWRRRDGLDICPWCAAGQGPYSYGDEHMRPLPQ